MSKLLLSIFVIICCVVPVAAEINIGINPIFMDQTITNSKLVSPFTSRGTGSELNIGFSANNIAMRSYYLCPVKTSFSSTLVNEGTTVKIKPVDLTTTFTATRFEIGMPYFNNGTIVEPFFVNSYTKLDYTINSDGINIPELLSNNTMGLGLFYGQKIVNRQAIYLKGSATPKDKIFDGTYNVVFKNCNLGAGYTYREYENIKIKGPFISVQLTF